MGQNKYRIATVDGWHFAQVLYWWWPFWWMNIERSAIGTHDRQTAEKICKRHATGAEYDSVQELGYWSSEKTTPTKAG
jgi:hypothetical protein